KMQAGDQLEPSLHAIYNVSKIFGRFYDFSMPTPVTEAKEGVYTYDGYHYSPEAMRGIAQEINDANPASPFLLTGKTFAEYHAEYNKRLEEYAKNPPPDAPEAPPAQEK